MPMKGLNKMIIRKCVTVILLFIISTPFLYCTSIFCSGTGLSKIKISGLPLEIQSVINAERQKDSLTWFDIYRVDLRKKGERNYIVMSHSGQNLCSLKVFGDGKSGKKEVVFRRAYFGAHYDSYLSVRTINKNTTVLIRTPMTSTRGAGYLLEMFLFENGAVREVFNYPIFYKEFDKSKEDVYFIDIDEKKFPHELLVYRGKFAEVKQERDLEGKAESNVVPISSTPVVKFFWNEKTRKFDELNYPSQ
jgi:hypothetical protein